MAGAAFCTLALAGAVTAVLVLDVLSTADAVPAGRGGQVNHTQMYLQARAQAMARDKARILGTGQVLNEKEAVLDKTLREYKKNLIEKTRLELLEYEPAFSFHDCREEIKSTLPYKVIKAMPKGAALHLHEPAITSLGWLVRNLTYRENVYMCTGPDRLIRLNAFLKAPSATDCQWKLVRDVRNAADDVKQFDEDLENNLDFLNEEFLERNASVNVAWKRFNKYFDQVIPLVFNAPILRDYLRQALQEFMEDNVQYMEIRGQMWGYTDLDGSPHDAAYGVNLFKQVSEDFVKDNKNFLGAKVIMSGLRFKTREIIKDEVKVAMQLRKQFPDFFLGYDLVGQEDPNQPLLYYIDALLYPSQQQGAGDAARDASPLPYFFHAGETDWQDTAVDENLLDALLLNTTRIGHGYALTKHPEWVDMARRKAVAVEVNPVSNQVLGLVKDLRNHPMVTLLTDEFPLVISSDDPATWKASPLTDDYFMAFMTMSGENSGLGFLKQLAINSIKYSAMNSTEKAAAMGLWQRLWDEFVDKQYQIIQHGQMMD